MRKTLMLIPLLALCGCVSITRAEYEHANGLPVLAEYTHDNGDLQIVYGPDFDPQINPETGVYTCKRGVRVAVYRDGILVRRWFQEHGRMKP